MGEIFLRPSKYGTKYKMNEREAIVVSLLAIFKALLTE